MLKTLPDNSIDSVVTDPPYALVSIVKRFGGANAAPAKGNDAYMRASAGFMGKQWDTGEVAFSEEFWAEVLRVLKPGGHVAAFGASRGYHRMACAIEDAGFEIRDSLMWIYGTGFPKSHNVGNGIDQKILRDSGVELEPTETVPNTSEGDPWRGFGTALKLAFEPIVLARKPLSEKTVAANVLRWGPGALNIGACRVEGQAKPFGKPTAAEGYNLHKRSEEWKPTDAGRWPANVVHDGSDEVVGAFPETKSGTLNAGHKQGAGMFGKVGGDRIINNYGFDSGSAARFFYSAKASRADRAGSNHPTVKPIALMQWLARLITPPGGTVLDPFAGSGTTGAACEREGFKCILIEKEVEYQNDIRNRLAPTLADAAE
jgi:site-specific DNA-methyltransferase (adenine-specific)